MYIVSLVASSTVSTNMLASSTKQVFGYFVLILFAQTFFQYRRDQRRAAKAAAAGHHDGGRRERDLAVAGAVETTTTEEEEDPVQVKYGDSIYLRGDWDGSPIVLEKHKLVFFTSAKVGCTTFKMLFRRMMGHEDWKVEEYEKMLPWNPETNGLKYLYDFDRERATEMMTSPEWTRALFVRDPKVRFLSAYLDKVMGHATYLRDKCCYYTGKCVHQARESLEGFLQVARFCADAHWQPQSRRMEQKYWPYINFVGHLETMAEDTKRLLEMVGAWDSYGASGWGDNGDEFVFQAKRGGVGRKHATDARKKLRQYMSPELEIQIDQFYADDYIIDKLGLEKLDVFGPNK